MKTAAWPPGQAPLEIIAFHLGGEQFCINTDPEDPGQAAASPLPVLPPPIIGAANLLGTVIAVIDLAARLGMAGTVDRVSEILSIARGEIQPGPILVHRSTSAIATA